MQGGKAIASGGYGCVFYPALRCKNKDRSKGISKLLRNKNAVEEYNEKKKILPALKKIRKYKKYILLPEEMCEADGLESEDKINLNTKCSQFHINDATLRNYTVLNMSFGGPDLDKYFRNTEINDNFIGINKSIIELIQHVISKYSSYGLIHSDLKPQNVLINEKDLSCKIIDWGLAIYNANNYSEMHEDLEWRPIQFNIPPSNILFSYFYTNELYEYLSLNSDASISELSEFIEDKFESFKNQYGNGHIEHMLYMIKILADNLKLSQTPKKIFFDYLAKCVKSFTKNKYFYDEEFFKNVYLYNCDIWGILTCYMVLLELSRTRFKFRDDDSHNIHDFRITLSQILYKNMFESCDKKISTNNLIRELENLNKFFSTNQTSNIVSIKYSSKRLKSLPSNAPSMNMNRPSDEILSKRMENINSLRDSKYASSKRASSTYLSVMSKTRSHTKKRKMKKCPKGTRRNKISNECERLSNTRRKRKRCPNGTRRNKKTGECVARH